jgi:hypothetical protein
MSIRVSSPPGRRRQFQLVTLVCGSLPIAALWEFLPELQQLASTTDRTQAADEASSATAPSPPPAPPTPFRTSDASATPSTPPETASKSGYPPRSPPPHRSLESAAPPLPSSSPPPHRATRPHRPPIVVHRRTSPRRRPEHRRPRHGQVALPVEDDIARPVLLANIDSPSFGAEQKNSGGIFQIKSIGYNEAEFILRLEQGHRPPRRRRSGRRATTATSRRHRPQMIAIIRDYEQEDTRTRTASQDRHPSARRRTTPDWRNS